MILEASAKSALLTAAIACIAVGVEIVRKGETLGGIAAIALGLAIVVVYTYLVEQQVSERVLRDLRRFKS